MGRKKKNNLSVNPNKLGMEPGAVDICYDGMGRVVNIWPDGTRTKKINASDFIYTGNQWCPECHVMMARTTGMWKCVSCQYYFTDDDLEMLGGYPTYESTFKDDYGPPDADYDSLYGDDGLEWEDL